MEKLPKIYHIEEMKSLKKKAGLGSLITYGLWLGSYIALPQFYSLPALAAYFTTVAIQSYAESKILVSEEYKRFKEVYREVLKMYLKLNDCYDFKEPLDIYALFDIVYKNDLLSVNLGNQCRNTKYDDDLMRELTLNNHGVCRHVATMLTDVYQQLGYQASPIVVTTHSMKEETKEVEIPEEFKKQMEEFQKMVQIEINGEVIPQDAIKMGEAKMFETRLVPQPITDRQNKHGNHAITRVNHDGISFNLDPMKRAVYIPGKEGYLISDDGEDIRFSEKGTKKFNKKRQIITLDQLGSIPLEDQMGMIDSAQQKVLKNQSYLSFFQNDVQPLLEEAEDLYQLILK